MDLCSTLGFRRLHQEGRDDIFSIIFLASEYGSLVFLQLEWREGKIPNNQK